MVSALSTRSAIAFTAIASTLRLSPALVAGFSFFYPPLPEIFTAHRSTASATRNRDTPGIHVI